MANLSQGVQRFGVNLQSAPLTLTGSSLDTGTGTTIYYFDSSGNLRSWVKGRASGLNTLLGANKDQLPAYAPFQINPGGTITTDDTKLSFETAINTATTGTTYYVSVSGSDANDGQSKAAPWQSIAKINASVFQPGDSILLKGGDIFSTTTGIVLNTSSVSNGTGGVTGAPITLSSHDGVATIKSTGCGVTVNNIDYINIRNLNLTGSSTGTYADYDGIKFQNNLTIPRTLSNIEITNCTIDNFPSCGIQIKTLPGSVGYANCKIVGCTVTACIIWGILTIIDPGTQSFNAVKTQRVFSNVFVQDCLVYSCPGDTTSNASTYDNISGNGISIGNCSTGVIDRCVSANNGGSGAGGGGGACGIWVFASDSIVMQYCEAYGQKMNPANHYDGSGFDIDYDCTACILQYCYAHGNEGAGIETVLAGVANIIRFNVFDNNSSGNDGEITLKGTGTGTLIYNNTVNATTTAFYVETTTGYTAKNNLLIGKSGATIIKKTSSDSSTFLNNLYWESAGNLRILVDSTTYTSLSSWGGDSNGIFANPQWSAPSTPVLFGFSANTNFNKRLSVYKLSSSSPGNNAGVNLSNMGLYDFEGVALATIYQGCLGAFSTALSVPAITSGSDLKNLVTWINTLDDNFTRANGAPGNNYVESPSGVFTIVSNKLQGSNITSTKYLLRPSGENSNFQKTIVETAIQGSNNFLNVLHHYQSNSGNYAVMGTLYFDSTKIYGAIDRLINSANNNFITGSGGGNGALFSAGHIYRFTFYTGTSSSTLYAGWEICDLANTSTVLDSYFGSDTTSTLLPSGSFGLSGYNNWNGISRYATFKA